MEGDGKEGWWMTWFDFQIVTWDIELRVVRPFWRWMPWLWFRVTTSVLR